MFSIKKLRLFNHFRRKLNVNRFATIIDGSNIAKQVKNEIKMKTSHLYTSHNVIPGLAIILVGDRRDSASYVNAKEKACAEVSFKSFHFQYNEDVVQAAILTKIDELNAGIFSSLYQAYINNRRCGYSQLCATVCMYRSNSTRSHHTAPSTATSRQTSLIKPPLTQ